MAEQSREECEGHSLVVTLHLLLSLLVSPSGWFASACLRSLSACVSITSQRAIYTPLWLCGAADGQAGWWERRSSSHSCDTKSFSRRCQCSFGWLSRSSHEPEGVAQDEGVSHRNVNLPNRSAQHNFQIFFFCTFLRAELSTVYTSLWNTIPCNAVL